MNNPDRQRPIGLTRREFLKLSGAALAAAALKNFPDGESEPLIESANKVFFDNGGVMFLNGSRFLPKVLYGLPGEHSALESWEKAKAAGADIVTMVFPTKEIVALAEQTGLKILTRLDYAFPDFIPNQAELERLKESPAVIGWEVDEPNQYWNMYKTEAGIPKDQALFELVKWLGARTRLPLRVTTDGRAHLIRNPDSREFLKTLYKFFGGAVISGPDVYETEARVAEEVADYSATLGEPSTATVWQVTGAFSENDSLTLGEMIYQTVSGIVAGSRGVGFYDSPWNCNRDICQVNLPGNGKINAFGKHLEDVKTIFGLLNRVEHGLTGIELKSGQNGAISFRTMRHWAFTRRRFGFCCNNDFGVSDSPASGGIDGLWPETNYVDIITGLEARSDRQGKLPVNLKPGQAAILCEVQYRDNP